ncbi:MAG: hypothetical protein HY300_08565 [Verrucomicrobia bacterium]|nr:hypothetical protein [Verrucomicrobiota bacterium]
MPKWSKFFIALLLLPACAGAVMALVRVLRVFGGATETWVPMLAGAASWCVVFLLLPKPMLVYVFGHELTHVVWSWLFGGEVKRFKATSDGGQVVLTKSNFLVALAPYFFPLYVVCVVLVFLAGHLIWGWSRYVVWLHVALGAAYAFHLTLTWHVLKTRQSDITSQGYLFSFVVILLGNVLVLLVGLPLLEPRVSVFHALGWWLQATGDVLRWIGARF